MISFAASDSLTPPPIPSTPEEVDRLGDEIALVAGHLHAGTWHLLMLVHSFDAADSFGYGFASTAHWLSWRIGISRGPAREKVRIARVLPSLPQISDALRHGQLSYSKVRALTRIATPENEGDMLEVGLAGTTDHVERFVRAWRQVDRNLEAEIDERRHEQRSVSHWIDEDGSWVLRGRLEPEVGAMLEKALDWARDELYQDSEARAEASPGQRRADALGLVVEAALNGGIGAPVEDDQSPDLPGSPTLRPASRTDRLQVVVHVDAETLVTDSTAGQSVLETGQGVSAETSRRIACDASKVVMVHDAEGSVLDVGRRSRTVPPAIRRALEVRDNGCRFPGCTTRWTDAHHINHWADGGETKLDNLVLLCRRHHRAVHEAGFGVEWGHEGSALLFTDPHGVRIPDVPVPPAVPARPIPAFQLERAAEGIEIDSGTTTPSWNGGRFDLDLAIATLWRPRGGSERTRRVEPRA